VCCSELDAVRGDGVPDSPIADALLALKHAVVHAPPHTGASWMSPSTAAPLSHCPSSPSLAASYQPPPHGLAASPGYDRGAVARSPAQPPAFPFTSSHHHHHHHHHQQQQQPQQQQHRFQGWCAFFTGRFLGKFVVKWILKIPAHLAFVATLPCETLMSAEQAINDKLQGTVATYLRCGGVVNNQIRKGLLLSLPVIVGTLSLPIPLQRVTSSHRRALGAQDNVILGMARKQ